MKRLFFAFCILLSTASPTVGANGITAWVSHACAFVTSALEADSGSEARGFATSAESSPSDPADSDEEEVEHSIGDGETSHLLSFVVPILRIEYSRGFERGESSTPSELAGDRLKRPPKFFEAA